MNTYLFIKNEMQLYIKQGNKYSVSNNSKPIIVFMGEKRIFNPI